jgi:hypothetical protein
MRWVLGAWALCLAGAVHAGETLHERGDFRFGVGPEPAYVVQRPLAEQWDAKAAGATGATWRSWLFDRQVDRRGKQSSYYVEYAYEPKTTSLLGDAGKYQITFNPAYQQLTIHEVRLRRSGAWQDRLDPDNISLARRESGFENDLSDGIVTALIVLNDVRVDDVVSVSYTIRGSNPILSGQDSDLAYFGWQSPMLDAYLRVLDEPGTRLSVHRENGAPEPVLRQTADATELQLHMHGAAGTVNESDYPVWYQPYPRAQVSRERTWSDVVDWALPLYPQVTTPLPDDLEARIATWSRLPSQADKLTAALRAVQDEVRYFGVEMGDNSHRPVAPDQTWIRRRGDCKDKAYLLSTILERLGIPSVPALTSTDEGKAVLDMIPSAYDFDHVIVRSLVAGKPVWVDPTISQQGGAATASNLTRYGVVLPIADGIKALEVVTAPTGVDDGTEVVETYASPVDGREVPLEIRTTYKGRAADARRAGFASERLSDTSRRYADYYRKRFGNLDVVREPEIDDDRARNVMVVTERYRLAAPFEAETAAVMGLTVRADAIDGAAALPATIQRAGPLSFSPRGAYRHEMRVAIPANWKPTFSEESDAVQGSHFDYQRKLTVNGSQAVLTHDMAVRDQDVTGAQAGKHLSDLRKTRDTLGSTLRFRMPQAQAQEERARRLRDLLRDVGAEENAP